MARLLVIGLLVLAAVLTNADNCTPGTTWKEDCNSCSCTENGVRACTDMACPTPGAVEGKAATLPGQTVQASYGICIPGFPIIRKGFICHCLAFFPLCVELPGYTANLAVGDTLPIAATLPGQTGQESYNCTPGTTWEEDCNSCFCSPEGVRACTLKACPPSGAVEGTASTLPGQTDNCTPGTTWKEDCNSCSCTEKGVRACTKMACPTTGAVEGAAATSTGQTLQASYGNCITGTAFIRDCLTCVCILGVPVCLPIPLCIPALPVGAALSIAATLPGQTGQESYNCTPGTTWQEDCNSCICSQNGVRACTLKACPRPGAVEGTASTLPGQIAVLQCVPGSSFKRDCNSCVCSADGMHAFCTLMACPSVTNTTS